MLNQGLDGLLGVTSSNRDLVVEWLSELTAARNYHAAQGELLAEAIEDVRAALEHVPMEQSPKRRGNVVSLPAVGRREPGESAVVVALR